METPALALQQHNKFAEPMIEIVIVLTSMVLVAGIIVVALAVIAVAALVFRLLVHVYTRIK